MAIGIMTAGVVGILGLQNTSTRANMEARRIATATNITRTWIERINRDALNWNSNNAGAILNTRYLDATAAACAWTVPDPRVAGIGLDVESYAFDWFGRDVDPANDDPRYCVQICSSWVWNNEAARVEARTWYIRESTDPNLAGLTNATYDDCASGNPAAIDAQVGPGGQLRAVTASTIVRWWPL